jgi:hypothetical protein
MVGGSALGGFELFTRAAIQPALKLGYPLVLASDALGELLDLTIHAQQNLNHDLTTSVIDRLRLDTLHTPIFDDPRL